MYAGRMMRQTPVFYDESLPLLVELVSNAIPNADATCTYLRDGQGCLYVYVHREQDADLIERLESELQVALGGYAPAFGSVIREELPSGEPSLIVIGDRRVRYIERRFAGADWAQKPAAVAMPPRMVFYSIKGGVGRTTALSVLATVLSSLT